MRLCGEGDGGDLLGGILAVSKVVCGSNPYIYYKQANHGAGAENLGRSPSSSAGGDGQPGAGMAFYIICK
jgi:hypothetical protein